MRQKTNCFIVLLNLLSFRIERTTERLAFINDIKNLSLLCTAYFHADSDEFALVEYLLLVGSTYWPCASL